MDFPLCIHIIFVCISSIMKYHVSLSSVLLSALVLASISTVIFFIDTSRKVPPRQIYLSHEGEQGRRRERENKEEKMTNDRVHGELQHTGMYLKVSVPSLRPVNKTTCNVT